jgi:hypothetical protein
VYAVDDDGFLRDPDATLFGTESANPGVLRTDDLRESRCLVLLGEPGAGKSTAVHDGARLVAAGVPVVPFDLAAYGSEEPPGARGVRRPGGHRLGGRERPALPAP